MTERGKFIVFEGGDGAGKSTQIELLADFLESEGFKVVLTREPGGIPETAQLRALVLEPKLKQDVVGQLLLFAADRRVHLLLGILPALEEGKTVISDRYYGSTQVYQGTQGLDSEIISNLENLAISFGGKRIEPDLTILVDVEPEVAIRRKESQGILTYFDGDSLEGQKRRREAYLNLAQKLGWEVVDGGKTEEEVFEKVLKILRERGILPEGKK